MKTTEFYGAYEAPVIEMETIAVEKGFATSGGGTAPESPFDNPWG